MTAQPHEVLSWLADEYPPTRPGRRFGVGRSSYVLTLAAFAMLLLVTPALIAAVLLESSWLLATAGALLVSGAAVVILAGRNAQTSRPAPSRGLRSRTGR